MYKEACTHACDAILRDPARVSRICTYVLPYPCAACVRAYVCVRDRYAIARAPTESMKIKCDRNAPSSPSEVKDAPECRDADVVVQCNTTRCDTPRRDARRPFCRRGSRGRALKSKMLRYVRFYMGFSLF